MATGGGPDNILSLERITDSFSAPITEEHAFAVIYECMKSLAKVLSAASAVAASASLAGKKKKKAAASLAVVAGTADIMLRKDGTVHDSTFVEEAASEGGGKLASGMRYLSKHEGVSGSQCGPVPTTSSNNLLNQYRKFFYFIDQHCIS